jgi:hypothetical protein
MRRLTVAASFVLLAMLAVAVAESSLAALILLFSATLKLSLSIELGEHYLQLFLPNAPYRPEVVVYNAATIASLVFTIVGGLAAAIWKFRRWRPQ